MTSQIKSARAVWSLAGERESNGAFRSVILTYFKSLLFRLLGNVVHVSMVCFRGRDAKRRFGMQTYRATARDAKKNVFSTKPGNADTSTGGGKRNG
jgi:hypothetical protein